MQLKKLLFLSALFVLGLTLSAQASNIGNGPPDQGGASDLNTYVEADHFTTASETLITQVEFWVLATAPSDYAGSIYWAIDADGAGAPGTVLFSGLASATGTATGSTPFGLNEYTYAFNTSVVLSAFTNYWLVLHNGPADSDPSLTGSTFYWETSSAYSGNSQSSLLGPPTWSSNDNELAFQLTAAKAPEPASLCLVGAGLLAAGLKRRKIAAKN